MRDNAQSRVVGHCETKIARYFTR